MSILLLPLWVLSGAMFPGQPGTLLGYLVSANPLSYAVSAVRRGLYGAVLPGGMLPPGRAPWLEVLVLLGFFTAALALAVRVCQRRR